jgi:hypothetical protein
MMLEITDCLDCLRICNQHRLDRAEHILRRQSLVDCINHICPDPICDRHTGGPSDIQSPLEAADQGIWFEWLSE